MSGSPRTSYANEVLGQAIVEKYGTVNRMCREEQASCGSLQPSVVGRLLHAKESPLRKDGTYRIVCQGLSEIFGIPTEKLFPADVYREVLPAGIEAKEGVSFSDLTREATQELLTVEDQRVEPSDDAMQEMLRNKIEAVLKNLTYREREIVRLRYGLGDGYSYTLEETGRIFKVTRERIRGIEAKALERLGHPFQSKQLKGFIEALKERADTIQQ